MNAVTSRGSLALALAACLLAAGEPYPVSADELAGYTNQPGYKVRTEPSYLSDESNTRIQGMKLLQSLAYIRDLPEGVFAKFLDIDELKGGVQMNRETGIRETGTEWRIERAGRVRGLRAYVIRNMCESYLHGAYLTMDSANGRIKTTPDELPSSAWLIRYAGKFNGYDAYTIQNLARSDGRWDFSYLEVDRQTGRLAVSRQRTEGVYWFIRNVDDLLPTE